MEIGILGLASSGKTTLFNLVTGSTEASLQSGRKNGTAMGMARVPDLRLERLSTMYKPRKHTPATIRFIEVPGIPEEHRESALNIAELRSMDVLMVVLRGFDNPAVPHPSGSVDPNRDLNYIEEELMLQDQIVIERRLERLQRDLARRKSPELVAEQQALQRCLSAIEAERPLRAESFSEQELKVIRGFTFLSIKPLLMVLNIDESEVGSDPADSAPWCELRQRPGVGFTAICATLEGELAQLEGDDCQLFMDEMGIAEPAIERLIREAYRLLGLISFFTVGEDECRAWSIRYGQPAVEAAGAIHSDVQRGFIRAEVVEHDELLEAGSLAVCRQRGSLRLEGKQYPVQDGDVVHFRFNV
jgi:GTP-binding protein YchF